MMVLGTLASGGGVTPPSGDAASSFIIFGRREGGGYSDFSYYGGTADGYNAFIAPNDLTLKSAVLHRYVNDTLTSDMRLFVSIDGVETDLVHKDAGWRGIGMDDTLSISIPEGSAVRFGCDGGSEDISAAFYLEDATGSAGPMFAMAHVNGLNAGMEEAIFFVDIAPFTPPPVPVDIIIRKVHYLCDIAAVAAHDIWLMPSGGGVYLGQLAIGETAITFDSELFVPAGSFLQAAAAGNNSGSGDPVFTFEIEVVGGSGADTPNMWPFIMTRTDNRLAGDLTLPFVCPADGQIVALDVSAQFGSSGEIQVTIDGGTALTVSAYAVDANVPSNYVLPSPIDVSAGDELVFSHTGTGVTGLGGCYTVWFQFDNDDDSAAAVPDNSAHRYWRLMCGGSDLSQQHIAQIEMRESVGGADVTSTVYAIAGSGDPSHCFDNVIAESDYWGISEGSVLVQDRWIGQDFGAGNEKNIVEIALSSRNTSSTTNLRYTVLHGMVQYSDDGVTWVNKFPFSTYEFWTQALTQVMPAYSQGDYTP